MTRNELGQWIDDDGNIIPLGSGDTGFYKVYYDYTDLSKFKYKMKVPEGVWEVDYDRFEFERSVKNNPEVLILSSSNCIDIIDNAPVVNLEAVKSIQYSIIQQSFQNEMDGGFMWSFDGADYRVDSMRVDSDNYKSLLSIMEYPANNLSNAPIKNNNGDTIIVNATQLRQMINDLQVWGMSLYGKKWQLEDMIKSATNYEAIKAIVW